MYEETIMALDKYMKDLKKLYKTNPELAKKEAIEALQRAGILGKDGKLASPYNGEKVNKGDFTRGPGEMRNSEQER